MTATKTISYTGTAYTEANEPIELPYDNYVVEDIIEPDRSVGINTGQILIWVPDIDAPVVITDADWYDFVQDCRTFG